MSRRLEKRRYVMTFLLAVLAGLTSFAALDGLAKDKTVTAAFKATPSPGVVSGTVRDMLTSASLQDVAVQAFNAVTGALLGTAQTSAEGTYSIETTADSIPLRLTFSRDGYDTKEFTGILAPFVLDAMLVAVIPEAPTGIDGAAGGVGIRAWWDANREPDLAGYNLWRAEGALSSGDPGFLRLNIAPIPSPDYSDTDLHGEADSYTYYVTAVDLGGNESVPSSVVVVEHGLIEVWLPDVQGDVGQEVRIPINARNACGIDPNGIDIRLLYDPALVEYANPDSIRVERTVVTADVIFQAFAPEAGRVNITCITEGDPLRGMGHLFDVYMKLRDDASEGACASTWFSSATFYDITPAPLRVDYTDTGQLCTNTTCGMGDLDGDGQVEDDDVMLALDIAVETIEPDPCQQSAGDLNGDGVIDSADALLIQRMVAQLPLNPEQLPQPGRKALRPQDLPLKALLKSDEPKTVEIASEDVAPGETVTVPIEIDDATGLSGCDLEVSFPADKTIVTLVDVVPGDLVSEFNNQVNLEDGHVRISMSTDSALVDAGGGAIAELTFQVTENAPAGLALPVNLTNAELKGGYGESFEWYVDVATEDGSLAVGDQSELRVTPETRNVSAATGTTAFNVLNVGSGSMLWVAGVAEGGDWASIPSGQGGTNTGTVQVIYAANTAPQSRTATVRVNAGSEQNLRTVEIIQAAFGMYTLTIQTQGQGTVDPEPGNHSYAAGTVVDLSATPAEGWRFDHWIGPVTNTAQAATSITTDADETVTAVFVEESIICLGGVLRPGRPLSPSRQVSGDLMVFLGVALTLLLCGPRRYRLPDCDRHIFQ